jgi:hypothetical protein
MRGRKVQLLRQRDGGGVLGAGALFRVQPQQPRRTSFGWGLSRRARRGPSGNHGEPPQRHAVPRSRLGAGFQLRRLPIDRTTEDAVSAIARARPRSPASARDCDALGLGRFCYPRRLRLAKIRSDPPVDNALRHDVGGGERSSGRGARGVEGHPVATSATNDRRY